MAAVKTSRILRDYHWWSKRAEYISKAKLYGTRRRNLRWLQSKSAFDPEETNNRRKMSGLPLIRRAKS